MVGMLKKSIEPRAVTRFVSGNFSGRAAPS
jgi:hypothetical protein